MILEHDFEPTAWGIENEVELVERSMGIQI